MFLPFDLKNLLFEQAGDLFELTFASMDLNRYPVFFPGCINTALPTIYYKMSLP